MMSAILTGQVVSNCAAYENRVFTWIMCSLIPSFYRFPMPVTDINKSTFRLDINALRAFAVLAVVAYHFDIPYFGGGFVGVDVFFVISGFLITSQIQQSLVAGRFSYTHFFASRIRRIFPALAVMCFSVLVFGWFFIFPSEYINYAKNAFQALYFGSNHAFFKESGGGYFDAVQTSVSPFLHTWSLSVEGQFYLILPILWVLIYKHCRKWQNTIIFAFLAIAAAYFAYDTANHNEQSFYSLPVRAWEFLAGACLVVLPVRMLQLLAVKWVAKICSAFGLFLIFGSVHFFNASLLWPSGWTVLPVVGAMLVLSANNVPSTHWLFKNWFVQRTGDLSYSLYLWHWPLIVFAKKYASIYQRQLSVIEIVTLLIVTIALAFLSWRYVESPIRKNKIFWTNKLLSIVVVLVLLAFWGVWRSLSIAKGAPERLAEYTKKEVLNGQDKFIFPYTKQCSLVTGQSSELNLCVVYKSKNVGDKTRLPDFIVWGDSHAHHYLPAISEASNASDLSGLMVTKAACRPTLPNEVAYHSSKAEQLSCTNFNNNVNTLIAVLPSVNTIILGRMWFHGETVIQTIKLTKSLVAAGKKVILIGALPDPGFDVPQIWRERNVWGRQTIDEISQPNDKNGLVLIDQYVKDELTQEIAFGHVVFLDAMRHFCDQTKCYLVKNGEKNFVDHNHITEAKALEFTEEFKRALKQ